MRSSSRPRTDRLAGFKAFAPALALALTGLIAGCAPFPTRTTVLPAGASRQSYVVDGRRYHVLTHAQGYRQRGIASWYGLHSVGLPTASGLPYNPDSMTAASKILPLGTWVRVTNLVNGRQVIVRIDDRGPFVRQRIIDLSYAAARQLKMIARGTALVEVRSIPQPLLPHTAAFALAPPPLAHNPLGHPPRMYLQIGAYAQRSRALALELHFMRLGIRPLRLFPVQRAGRILYILQVGPIAHVRELDRLSGRLTSMGFLKTEVIIR
ncbi:rare lipoprotein A [mine drainage metagenome]|uniref:Rare lipoprotein A n=2 Tax=mine drainage metagenome TaxID=410659 RepID=T1C2U8_9ZZZZ